MEEISAHLMRGRPYVGREVCKVAEMFVNNSSIKFNRGGLRFLGAIFYQCPNIAH